MRHNSLACHDSALDGHTVLGFVGKIALPALCFQEAVTSAGYSVLMSATVPSPRRRPRKAVPAPPPPPRRPSSLPVVDETSAGGVVVKVEGGRAYVAIIARRNRAGR